MAYEKDYRKRILNFYYENGKTKTLFQFNISSSTLYGWIKLKKETGDLSSRTRKRKFKVLDPEKLDEYMKEPKNADKYIREIAKDFGCGKETVRVALKKLGYTRKKNRQNTMVSFVLGQLCVAHGNLSCRKSRMLPHTGLFLLWKVHFKCESAVV